MRLGYGRLELVNVFQDVVHVLYQLLHVSDFSTFDSELEVAFIGRLQELFLVDIDSFLVFRLLLHPV